MAMTNEAMGEMFSGICETVLGVAPVPAGLPSPASADERTLAGCVQMVGDWEGAVTIHCGAVLARELAGRMYEEDPKTVSLEQIQDVLQELTNMLAGNLKPLLPRPCSLSLPTVIEGHHYTLKVIGSHPINEVSYEVEGRPILVALLEKSP